MGGTLTVSRIKTDGRVSNSDIARMVQEVHDCVHSFQADVAHKLEGHQIILSSQITQVRDKVDMVEGKVNDVITEVGRTNANVRAAEQEIAHTKGVLSVVYGARKDERTGEIKVDKKTAIWNMPLWAGIPAALAIVAGGSGVYKLLVELAEAAHHYLMTAAK